MILVASIVNLVHARSTSDREQAVRRMGPAAQVLSVVIPTAVYVALIPLIGIYVASLAADRLLHEMARPLRLGADARGRDRRAGRSTFIVFEKWFLVPLPKGPIEDFWDL